MSSPPPGLPPIFPIHLKGTWQRNWRLGTELVDAATVSFSLDGIFVVGRRSNPLRGLLWNSFRLALRILLLGTFISVVFTCIGITWRACVQNAVSGGGCYGTWVWFGPLIAIPVLLFGGWIVRRIARRWMEPIIGEQIVWANISKIATDGKGIDIVATGKFGSFNARLSPQKHSPSLIAAIRERRLPGGRGGESATLIRSPWMDHGAAMTLFGVMIWGGIKVEPWLTHMAVAVERPEQAVPPSMTLKALDAHSESACPGSSNNKEGVHAFREKNDLVWEIQGNPAAQVELLRMKAGDSRYEVVERLSATSGRKTGFFKGDDAGIVVLTSPGPTVSTLLAGGRLEDLAIASCAGLVMDIALAMPADKASIQAERDGNDLLVKAEQLTEPGRFLAVRRRASTRGGLFKWCEVATEGDDIRTVVASTAGVNFPSFFSGGNEEAIVYFIPTNKFESARRLAVGGVVQRCLEADSLWAAGVATQRVVVSEDTRHTMIRWQTGFLAHAMPMFSPSASPLEVVQGIIDQYARVYTDLHPETESVEDMNAAFFDAVDWTNVFDILSFGGDFKVIEQLHTGIAEVGGETSGNYALVRMGQAFLERFPAEPSRYSARFNIGKAWLNAPAKLGLNKERAIAWEIVGRFILADVGRHLEDDINEGRLGRVDWVRTVPLVVQLAHVGVRIDIQSSSMRKVMIAWLTGDFEYLADRAFKKAAQVFGQGASLGLNKYSLTQSISIGSMVRMSTLLQNGSEIGWVAQYDVRQIRTKWEIGNNVPESAIFAMSAAYSEADGSTAGIAISNGSVSNWLWKPDMGGLITINQKGETFFIDMRRGGYVNQRFRRPGISLSDFSSVFQDIQETHGSAFQTYLLAGDGELRLNPDRSSQEIRERRLLALASYHQNPILCVVDLPKGLVRQGYTLYQAAQIAMVALETPEGAGGPGLKVRAVANFDTGARDVMLARNGFGRTIREGKLPLSMATNLFIIEKL